MSIAGKINLIVNKTVLRMAMEHRPDQSRRYGDRRTESKTIPFRDRRLGMDRRDRADKSRRMERRVA